MDKAEQPTTQADRRLDELKPRDIDGHLSDAIQDCLRQRFGLVLSTSETTIMAQGAIAALNTRTSSLAAQDGLVEALQFYANHLSFPLNAWVQPTKVDYSLGGDGHWPDGPPIPSSALLADQGRIARKALSAIKEQHHD